MTSRALRNYLLLLAAIAVGASLGQAQTLTATRILQTDPSIVYTGTWYPNYESPNIGGSATLTNAKGATATLSFTGTGITWIGILDPYSGLAQVYLDGTPNTVDTYGPTTLYRQPLFSVHGRSARTLSPFKSCTRGTGRRTAPGSGSTLSTLKTAPVSSAE